MQPQKAPPKSFLVDQLLNYAYTHPRAADCMFASEPTVCPRCACELCFIMREEYGRKTLFCQHCGLVFKEKELAAA